MSDNKPTRLAAYCKEQRLRLGLRVVDVAQMVGCKVNKLVRFEETGCITDDHLERLVEVLGIDESTLDALVDADCIERLERLKDQRARRKEQQSKGEAPHPIRTYLSIYREEES